MLHGPRGRAAILVIEVGRSGSARKRRNHLSGRSRRGEGDFWKRPQQREASGQDADKLEHDPSGGITATALAFREIARKARQWQAPAGPRGGVEFFMERLVAHGASNADADPLRSAVA